MPEVDFVRERSRVLMAAIELLNVDSLDHGLLDNAAVLARAEVNFVIVGAAARLIALRLIV